MHPEPHPLDYDWRFTPATRRDLAKRLGGHALLCGTASVASELTHATSVDRNPSRQPDILADISRDRPVDARFDSVLLDPPWYPATTRRWLSWAAAHVDLGARMFCTLWPESTRPSAPSERRVLLDDLASWSTVILHPSTVAYATPLFEAEALATRGLTRTERRGDLLEIHIHTRPTLALPCPHHAVWQRFVIGHYQLALRVEPLASGPTGIAPHPGAVGWTFPSVSRRANGRSAIGLWSSRHEVATVMGADLPARLEQALRRLPGPSLGQLDPALTPLDSWHLPNRHDGLEFTWTHLE